MRLARALLRMVCSLLRHKHAMLRLARLLVRSARTLLCHSAHAAANSPARQSLRPAQLLRPQRALLRLACAWCSAPRAHKVGSLQHVAKSTACTLRLKDEKVYMESVNRIKVGPTWIVSHQNDGVHPNRVGRMHIII